MKSARKERLLSHVPVLSQRCCALASMKDTSKISLQQVKSDLQLVGGSLSVAVMFREGFETQDAADADSQQALSRTVRLRKREVGSCARWC